MSRSPISEHPADHNGRRRIKDRRFLVSQPYKTERRTNWKRRYGYDRRLMHQKNMNSDEKRTMNPENF